MKRAKLTESTKFIQLLCICLISLSGCQTSPNATPVFERSVLSSDGRDGIKVRAGDTLYSLAWRLGVDYQTLAIANKISSPYVIHPGQVIYLLSPKGVSKSNPASDPAAVTLVKPKPVKPPLGNKLPKPSNANARKLPRVAVSDWRWPLEGTVVGKFSSKSGGNRGIDIASQKAQPVRCAADGIVVYAGAGLRGYNNLVIVKHNDLYLSAYANNKKIFVKEGEEVKAGQKFAEISIKSKQNGTLHFEIRKRGKPVDPLSLLPTK